MPWVALMPERSSAQLPPAPRWKQAGRTIHVGPQGDVRTLAEAARLAADGDIVEVAAGEYRGDVAVWKQHDLVIRGTGERPSLIANGASAEGKAIFVVRGDRVRIENLAFFGAAVRDRNGAGIRLEKGQLQINGCHFEGNQNGILTGGGEQIELEIDRSSFVANGAGDGQSHNLYAGAIGRLSVSASYFARSQVGHLLKSRARESLIVYSRLTGEDGTSSYELDFPNGGVARVMGCLIQQGPRSENSTIISYGAEGYRWPSNELQLTFNTIVNDRPSGGIFIRVAPGQVRAEVLDNLLVGSGEMGVKTDSALIRNKVGNRGEFADPARMDYRLKKSSPHVGAAGLVGLLTAGRPHPDKEYVHPADSRKLPDPGSLTPLSPGAFQSLAN